MQITLYVSETGQRLHATSSCRGSLALALWTTGLLHSEALCSGLGRCGRCRVRYLRDIPNLVPKEELVLTEEECKRGVRLACCHEVTPHDAPILLEVSENALAKVATATKVSCATHKPLGLAFDLGTTSIAWQAIVLEGEQQGQICAQQSFLNPQIGSGSDVLSRLSLAKEKNLRTRLSTVVQESLKDVVAGLGRAVTKICLVANPIMTGLFFGDDCTSLGQAPYTIHEHGDVWRHIDTLPAIYVPPLPGPYLGGDITAACVALLAKDVPKPWLLCDLGTNGEFALCSATSELFFSSVPMGPCMEGVGMNCGGLARRNVATRFVLTPKGLEGRGEGETFLAISCTGYLSLLSILLRLGLLSKDGNFAKESGVLPLAQNIFAKCVTEGRTRLNLTETLWIDGFDVEEVLKVRAAFVTAVKQLLSCASLTPQSLQTIYLGGALGQHVCTNDLETLGFLPQGLGSRVETLGNSALLGARVLLMQEGELKEAVLRCTKGHVLTLTKCDHFQEQYLGAMRFGSFE